MMQRFKREMPQALMAKEMWNMWERMRDGEKNTSCLASRKESGVINCEVRSEIVYIQSVSPCGW